jgi:hypothetical protein
VKRPRRVAVAAIAALAATGLLGACTSNPSTKAVAKDIVQSITVPGGDPLPQAQQDCMMDVLDEMSSDQLDNLGEENEGATVGPESGGDEEMRAFVDRLQECQGATPDTSSAPDSGSTPDDGTTPASEPATATTEG